MEEPSGREVSMQEHGLMIYPASGWRWVFFRAPMWLWRMGAAPAMRFRFCVLSCWGRKSGEARHTILEWVEDGGKLYLGAGWGPRSQWVRNILANPNVTVDSGLGVVRGQALRVIDGDLMRRLYPHMKKSPTWEQYCASWGVDGNSPDDVAAKAGQLWTFVVEPQPEAAGESPPVLKPDLWWVPVLAAVALLAWVLV